MFVIKILVVLEILLTGSFRFSYRLYQTTLASLQSVASQNMLWLGLRRHKPALLTLAYDLAHRRQVPDFLAPTPLIGRQIPPTAQPLEA